MKYLKKVVAMIGILFLFLMGGLIFITSKGMDPLILPKELEIPEVEDLIEEEVSLIIPKGMTVESRIATPEGYTCTDTTDDENFINFVRNYPVKEDGSPGHVVMILDICENEQGERAFLLAQGYVPAQEFHILKNPLHENDPWYYESEITYPLRTPEYTFPEGSLKRLCY